MRAKDAMIAWSPAGSHWPTAGKVKVVPYPRRRSDPRHWDDLYAAHAPYVTAMKPNPSFELACRLLVFCELVVSQGIDPQEAHRAFMEIDEYAELVGRHMALGISDLVGSKAKAEA